MILTTMDTFDNQISNICGSVFKGVLSHMDSTDNIGGFEFQFKLIKVK